jgi:hypothetical protein
MKKWIIFTAVYALLITWLASIAVDNMWGPDKQDTIYIGIIFYLILLVLFLVIKGIKKLTNKTKI